MKNSHVIGWACIIAGLYILHPGLGFIAFGLLCLAT